MLGQIHYLENKYRQAEMAFRKALEQNQWSAQAHYNLAILLEKEGHLHEASEHLEKVLAVDPFSIDTSARLVTLYNRLGNSAKRTERLRKLLSLKPSSMEYGYLRANQSQDLEGTLHTYKKKFLFSDTSPYSLKAMAIIATLTEDYEEAVEQYNSYLLTLTGESEKASITNEVRRLEEVIQGKEPLRRTPV
jgi:tetratricopeptide (TPR) repeat protein